MSKDITPILTGWEHDPDEMQVRIVTGDDGRDKIQMRMDLGLLQMEMSGRPDGRRPDDHESLLELYEARSSADDFSLDIAACAALMQEGRQYYQRYLAAFHLQRYDLVVRDTDRNLRLFAFVVRHASRPRDKIEFDQYRPYVMMMRTRALALDALAKNDSSQAIVQIDEGIEGIREFLKDYEQSDHEAECMELGFLIRWKRDIESNRPRGPLERLEQQLELAVALEDYEEAARIRDQLVRLRGTEIASSEPHP
ncbi:UvrB/uvrC motif-containing protein [Singulisphaera sp. GP187]|uniref:UvrB/UvrC motif-containing protein n=1 Tax=Singulisphaera sp. GP187 TaxID=1882752 RepID=UPI00092C8058|nr:UvrB/UvrC motif-containing protein [Singulisphaera sp. GP187]SIO21544.1 UvrB/uvrC motif-containing protein [Singulisphaera sp. GP187]